MSHRTQSALQRSNELLSMESELQDLLQNNTTLTYTQKKSFEKLLKYTFDLLQAPMGDGGSLIDHSSIELYSKMQSLVSSLATVLMADDIDDTTRFEHTTRLLQGDDDDDEDEWSEGDSEDMQQLTSKPLQNVLKTRLRDVSSRESLRSPSFSSPKLPVFHPDQRLQHERFRVLNTPVPRSFSAGNNISSRRSSGMHSPMNSPSPLEPRHYDPTSQRHPMQERYESRRNSLLSWNGSQGGTPTSNKKRYSMRF